MPCPPGDAVTELLLEKGPEKIRAALLRDGELFRYEEEAPGAVAAEDILVVRVDRCVPALEAAFVKMGPLGTGYLPYQEMRGVKVPPRSGEKLLAQVKKAPVGSKQAYLTMDIALAGRGAVLLPLSDKRTVSASVPEGEEKDRLQALADLCLPDSLNDRIRNILRNLFRRELRMREMGKLVMAEGGWAAAKGTPFEMSFTIVCEKATIKLDASGYHIYPVKGKPITPKLDVKAGPTGWHQELTYFVNCVAKGVRPDKYQTLDSIVDTMKLIFAEEKSVKTGRVVKVR